MLPHPLLQGPYLIQQAKSTTCGTKPFSLWGPQ
jgi:hypothetical protein